MKREQIQTLRTRFTNTNIVPRETLIDLTGAIQAAVTTKRKTTKILVTHFPDFIRGWFFPTFDFVEDIFVRKCAEMLADGNDPSDIFDFFLAASRDEAKLRALVGAD